MLTGRCVDSPLFLEQSKRKGPLLGKADADKESVSDMTGNHI